MISGSWYMLWYSQVNEDWPSPSPGGYSGMCHGNFESWPLHKMIQFSKKIRPIYIPSPRSWTKVWPKLTILFSNFCKVKPILAQILENLAKKKTIISYTEVCIFNMGSMTCWRLICLPMFAAQPWRDFCQEYSSSAGLLLKCLPLIRQSLSVHCNLEHDL